MKIGYVLYDYPILSETWIPLEIEEWINRGVDIKVHRIVNPVIDVSDCDFLLSHFASSALRASQMGIPFGFISHARDIWVDNGETFRKVVASKNFRFAGYLSSYHKKKFLEWGVPENKLVEWNNCIDFSRLLRTRTMGRKVICGGRFVDKKALDIAIKAVPNITVFGDGELADELRKISTEAKFMGWLNREEMHDLMEEAWCLVAPSRVSLNGDTEGISTLVLEALAMGLQVITTNVAGHKDLKVFGDRVHFIKQNDIEAIRELVDTLPHTYDLSCRRILEKTRSPKAVIDNLEKKIQSI